MTDVEYSEQDTVANLSKEQLELMAKSEHDWVVSFIEERTLFDVHRIRLMLELGAIEAKRRLGKQIFRKEEGK